MTRIAAVILAGGKGERLGGINKALIEIGGQTLIDRARDAVAGCAPILVAVGSAPFEAAGLTPVADLPTDYAGPLAGVAAAVDVVGATDVQLLLSLAVDTPFFPHDFLARAMPLIEGADAVIGCFGTQDYPTNVLWRLGAIRDLPGAVRNDIAPHSLKRLAARLQSVRLDYAAFAADDPFANANTPEDLTYLRARAARISRA